MKWILAIVIISTIKANGAEVFFTPSAQCEENISERISHSKKIVAAVYAINNDKIVKALKAAFNSGTEIRVLSDSLQAAGSSSRVLELYEFNLPIRIHSVNKIMHNKFAVFDDEEIVTGSYNWTEPASNDNAENCVFIKDPGVAHKYADEFEDLWTRNTEAKSKAKIEKIRSHQGNTGKGDSTDQNLTDEKPKRKPRKPKTPKDDGDEKKPKRKPKVIRNDDPVG